MLQHREYHRSQYHLYPINCTTFWMLQSYHKRRKILDGIFLWHENVHISRSHWIIQICANCNFWLFIAFRSWDIATSCVHSTLEAQLPVVQYQKENISRNQLPSAFSSGSCPYKLLWKGVAYPLSYSKTLRMRMIYAGQHIFGTFLIKLKVFQLQSKHEDQTHELVFGPQTRHSHGTLASALI